MPQPRFRSRSKKRVQKKMPGGTTRLTYEDRKTKVHKCSSCGAKLKGIPRLSATKAKHTPKTKKRPERPFGGFLCASCARKRLKAEARST